MNKLSSVSFALREKAVQTCVKGYIVLHGSGAPAPIPASADQRCLKAVRVHVLMHQLLSVQALQRLEVSMDVVLLGVGKGKGGKGREVWVVA